MDIDEKLENMKHTRSLKPWNVSKTGGPARNNQSRGSYNNTGATPRTNIPATLRSHACIICKKDDHTEGEECGFLQNKDPTTI